MHRLSSSMLQTNEIRFLKILGKQEVKDKSYPCSVFQLSYLRHQEWFLWPRGRNGPPETRLLLLLFSRSVISNFLQPHGLQHSRPPCFSLSPGVCPNLCSLSQWCYPTISSSVVPFSPHLQSFLASGSFPMSWLFASGSQSIGASASILPMNIQGWYPLGLTGLISFQSKGLSNTTVWKHQFFGAQPSLWPSSHIHTWLLAKP